MQQDSGVVETVSEKALQMLERALLSNALQALEGLVQMLLGVVASQEAAYARPRPPDLVFRALWSELDGIRAALAELHPIAASTVRNTGLRRAELLGLTWNRVDLSRSALRLEVTKSGKRREVPINDACYRALSSLQPKEGGRVFRTCTICTAYENAVDAAKLDDVTFHTLRHTFASWAMIKGGGAQGPSGTSRTQQPRHDDEVRAPRSGTSPHRSFSP